MAPLILATKLHIPPAGFGKTTLLSAWVAGCAQPVAWLTLDAGDGDPSVFLSYLAAALRTVNPVVGESALPAFQSQQPPVEAILAVLLNDIVAAAQEFTLVLDDYHMVESPAVDAAIRFLVTHLPACLHLVIASREDPPLPLARLRAGGRLTEVRAVDLRFTHDETDAFLNQSMGLALGEPEIATLESRTEGWIAGLHLAALSLQGRQDAPALIQSFSGSHHFVLDYLVEEVLGRQPPHVQTFLLRTSILDRLCGPLCDAVVYGEDGPPHPHSGQAILQSLERANLFLIPLDAEQRWYRYHALFRDLLRQCLSQASVLAPSDAAGGAGTADGAGTSGVAVYHRRAGRWLEENGLDVEAFHYAVAAGDHERAARLAQGKGMPLHFRGAVTPVLNWLASLPPSTLKAMPALGVIYASALLFAGKLADIDEILRGAEQGLPAAEDDAGAADLIGHIAAIRASLAVPQHDAEEIITQARRALAYLPPDNLPVRASMTWALAYACQLQGDRVAAAKGFAEALASSQALGHFIITILATLGIGAIQESDNQLHQAAATYEHFLCLAGNPPTPVACQAHLGLCRISYEHNDLTAAEEHLRRAADLAQQLDVTDRTVACLLLAARIRLATGKMDAAAVQAAEAEKIMRRHNFLQRAGDVAAVQALVPLRQQVEARGWADERLRTMALQAVALQAQGNEGDATRLLREVLAAAAPGDFVRLFVDEGAAMARLLQAAVRRGIMVDACAALLAAFAPADVPGGESPTKPLVEGLSKRELEVLHLIALGLSNREIGERLFLALGTVKGYNRALFAKLQVQRRTEAVAKARALGLLPRDLLS